MRWSYKTVHFERQKEGLLGHTFIDQQEIEDTLNSFGQVGWELVSMFDVQDGVIAVCKRPLVEEEVQEPVQEEEAEPFLQEHHEIPPVAAAQQDPPDFTIPEAALYSDDETIELVDDFQEQDEEPDSQQHEEPEEGEEESPASLGNIRIE